MIDSTNPRILANNIKKLLARINAIVPGTVVTGNPSGSGFNTLLTKIKIGDSKYKLPDAVVANPEAEASTDLTKLTVGSTIYGIPGGGGGFIDPSTVIQARSLISNNTATYTATKDCIVVFKLLASSNDVAWVKIGDVVMWYSNASSSQLFNGGSLLVKAGQTVTLYQSSAMVDGEYTVYDLL